MPRRQFISDLQEASEPGKFPHLTNVTAGEDDGTISCTFVPIETSVSPIDVALLLTGECISALLLLIMLHCRPMFWLIV